MKQIPFFITIPHSGEKVPDFCDWLQGLEEKILMCDVDRFVDRLYEPHLNKVSVPMVKTEWHRYAVDLNRLPEDVDCTSVIGNANRAGMHNRGFHWVVTTTGIPLMKAPISEQAHHQLRELIYEPFHKEVRAMFQNFHTKGFKNIYHLDAHSMPSLGTKMHRDPGEYRAEVVVSDCENTSAHPNFVDLVISAYAKAGFRVAYNWPYGGGRVTEQYGAPSKGHHSVQVELNRAMYMDEASKQWLPEKAQKCAEKVRVAVDYIREKLVSFPH